MRLWLSSLKFNDVDAPVDCLSGLIRSPLKSLLETATEPFCPQILLPMSPVKLLPMSPVRTLPDLPKGEQKFFSQMIERFLSEQATGVSS